MLLAYYLGVLALPLVQVKRWIDDVGSGEGSDRTDDMCSFCFPNDDD